METDLGTTLNLIHAEQQAADEEVQSPVESSAIEELRIYAQTHFGAELSHSYAALLAKADGLDFNGTTIYASSQRRLLGGGVLLGFREANEVFRQGGERHYILYGETGDELFAEDQKSRSWCILDRASMSVLEIFPNDADLFDRVLQRAYAA